MKSSVIRTSGVEQLRADDLQRQQAHGMREMQMWEFDLFQDVHDGSQSSIVRRMQPKHAIEFETV